MATTQLSFFLGDSEFFAHSLGPCCGLDCASAPLEVLLDTYLTGPLEFWKQSATGEGVRERTKRRSRGEASKRERESEGSGETVFFNWAPRPPEVRALVWVSFSLRARLQTIFSKRERQGERAPRSRAVFFFGTHCCPALGSLELVSPPACVFNSLRFRSASPLFSRWDCPSSRERSHFRPKRRKRETERT